jgi:peptidyl-prolyl cis-trans isomerase B (cyclophilin B)
MFRFTPFFVLLPIILTVIQGCNRAVSTSQFSCLTINFSCLTENTAVILQTTKGPITILLDGENSPLTSGNFFDLIRRGTYNGTVFHRVIREPLPFVVQGGDPASADPKTPTSSFGAGNFVDPKSGESRFIPLEFRIQNSKQLIYGKELLSPGSSEKPILTHLRGSVAMARSNDPNSASSQFYIALEALPELDGRYAVFGRVVKGMEVVDKIQQGDKIISAKVLPSTNAVK